MRLDTGYAVRPAVLLLLASFGALAQEPPAADRQDRFTVGVLAGSMFPQDRAYDTAAPEFGLVVAYSPEWRRMRLDLSAFATAGRSSERGVSAIVSWFLTEGAARPFLGAGAGMAWLGMNYALANQVGWHLIDYPETKPHVPFVALAAGVDLGRGRQHPWTLSAEAHLPFDYLAFDVRFPSVLAVVRTAL
jgi:hypothetical protein